MLLGVFRRDPTADTTHMPKPAPKTKPPAKTAKAPKAPAKPDQRTGPSTKVELAAEWVPIAKLTPWGDNPRKNDGEPVRKVAESIKRFGFASPIIARLADGMIIAGHTRWKAAQELGLETVPVRYMDLDPADAKLLALADNRVAEEAEWDEEKLAGILVAMKAEGVDIGATGFDDEELNSLINAEFSPGTIDDQGNMCEVGVVECPQCGHEFTPKD